MKKRRESAEEEYRRTHVRVLCYTCNRFYMEHKATLEELGAECQECVRKESERLRRVLADRGISL